MIAPRFPLAALALVLAVVAQGSEYLERAPAPLPPTAAHGESIAVLIGAAMWLIGGNVIIAAHHARRGRPWWWSLRHPWIFPALSWGEYAALGTLAAASLAMFGIATSN